MRASLVLALGLLGTMAPAQAAVTVGDAGDGVLIAGGAAVEGSSTVTCPEGEAVQVAVHLNQRVGAGRVAFGRTTQPSFLTCTGEEQAVSYALVASGDPFGHSADALAFRTGPALLTVAVIACVPVEEGERCEVIHQVREQVELREE
jgi:hypothetical protein